MGRWRVRGGRTDREARCGRKARLTPAGLSVCLALLLCLAHSRVALRPLPRRA